MESQSFEAQKILAIERLAQLEDAGTLRIIMQLLIASSDADAMSDAAFKKFMVERRHDIFNQDERVPGEAVLEKLRARALAAKR